MQIAAITIPVRDQSAAAAFYSDVLGFRRAASGTIHGDRQYILMQPPGGIAGVSLMAESAQMPAGSAQGTILQTLDVDNECAKLARKGLVISPVTDAEWGRFATFADLDGNGWLIAEARRSV